MEEINQDELYLHRAMNFCALMNLAHKKGMKTGWSKNHSDKKPCFGGGWNIAWIVAPSGLQARYHIKDDVNMPKNLEVENGTEWNEKDETLLALKEISGL